jgi:hypothetical protein
MKNDNVYPIETLLTNEPYFVIVCFRLRQLKEYVEIEHLAGRKVSDSLMNVHIDNLVNSYGVLLYNEAVDLVIHGKKAS